MNAYYKILAAENKGEKDNPHGGKLIKWNVTLLNAAGDQLANCYWQRKPDSDVTVGDVIQGEVKRGDYGPRFFWGKVEDGSPNPFQSDGAPPSSTAPTAGPPTGPEQGSVPPPRNPEAAVQDRGLSQDERIHWAVCLKAAAEVYMGTGDDHPTEPGNALLSLARQLYEASPHSPPSTGRPSSETNGEGVAPPAAPSPESLEDRVRNAPAEMHVDQFDQF